VRVSASAVPDNARTGFTCRRGEDSLGSTWVHLTGELDLATAVQLEQTLGQAQSDSRLVVLDLRDLAFIDCAGMRVVINAAEQARRQGNRLIVIRGAPQIDKVFTLTASARPVVEIVDPNSRGTTGADRKLAGAVICLSARA
jgi:anti-anti-sigma factor